MSRPCPQCTKPLPSSELAPCFPPHEPLTSTSPAPSMMDEEEYYVVPQKRLVNSRSFLNRVTERLEWYAWETKVVMHALCERCLERMYVCLEKDLVLADEEKRMAQACTNRLEEGAAFRSMQNLGLMSLTKPLGTRERYETARQANDLLAGELDNVLRQLEVVCAEAQALKEEAHGLALEEAAFANRAMTWRGDKHVFQEKRDAAKARFKFAFDEAETMKKSTTSNDAFRVSDTSPYVCINGLRMGRKPLSDEVGTAWNDVEGATTLPASAYDDVDWDEVSAAWGEACLLLSRLAKYARSLSQPGKKPFEFSEYILIPRGKRSLIREKRRPERLHRLYFEGSASSMAATTRVPSSMSTKSALTTRTLLDFTTSTTTSLLSHIGEVVGVTSATNPNIESFNKAMVGFLVCLKELAEVARDSARGKHLDLNDKLYPVKAELRAVVSVRSQSGGSIGVRPTQQRDTSDIMDASIKGLSIQTTTEASDARRWTDACNFTLSNSKWLLVWASPTGATTVASQPPSPAGLEKR